MKAKKEETIVSKPKDNDAIKSIKQLEVESHRPLRPSIKLDITPSPSPRVDLLAIPKEDKGNLSDTSPSRKTRNYNVRQKLVKAIQIYEKLLLRGD